jgi:hypothetical protein
LKILVGLFMFSQAKHFARDTKDSRCFFRLLLNIVSKSTVFDLLLEADFTSLYYEDAETLSTRGIFLRCRPWNFHYDWIGI